MIRHKGECKDEALRGTIVLLLPQLTPPRPCINIVDSGGYKDTKTGCRSCFGSHWCSGHLHCQHKIQFCKSPREMDSRTENTILNVPVWRRFRFWHLIQHSCYLLPVIKVFPLVIELQNDTDNLQNL